MNCNQGGCKRCEDRIKGKIKTGEQLEKCLCMHAEASAILQNSKECQGSTLYVTGEPCIQCAKLILSVGIERVVCFQGQYIDNGVFLLNKKNKDGKNVIVERYKWIRPLLLISSRPGRIWDRLKCYAMEYKKKDWPMTICNSEVY